MPVMLLAAAMAPAQAQAERTLMPEGSKEVTLGATIGNAPSRYGSAQRATYLLPQFGVQWSNGVFVDGLTLGMQMSDDPLLNYGPLLALDLGGPGADGSKNRLRAVAGAFVNYTPMQELSLQAHMFAPAGGGGGTQLSARVSTDANLAPRHQLTTGLGAGFMDRSAMHKDFGTALYRPSGGVRDVYADLHWHWQFSPKYTLTSAVKASRLLGGAAASPRTIERTGIASSVTLRYSY